VRARNKEAIIPKESCRSALNDYNGLRLLELFFCCCCGNEPETRVGFLTYHQARHLKQTCGLRGYPRTGCRVWDISESGQKAFGESGVFSHEASLRNCSMRDHEKAKKTHRLVSLLEPVYDRVLPNARAFQVVSKSCERAPVTPRPLYVGDYCMVRDLRER
jgi:hypothetical protein